MISKTIFAVALFASVAAPSAAQTCNPFKHVDHAIIVSVKINDQGPFDFLFDTGSEMTILDPSLVRELHIQTVGDAHIGGIGMSTKALYINVRSVEMGEHHTPLRAVSTDVKAFHVGIRGIIGSNFFEMFDGVRIDNKQSCIAIN